MHTTSMCTLIYRLFTFEKDARGQRARFIMENQEAQIQEARQSCWNQGQALL